MNERIKLLASQAGFSPDPYGTWPTITPIGPELEKFAKLIVRECGEWCGHDPQGVAAMFKHFGVEE